MKICGVYCFDTDTALESLGAGRFRAHISDRWSIGTGPNGGYLSALIARAVTAAVGTTDQSLRVINAHFLRAPTFGPADVHVTIERAGRTVTTCSARLEQAGLPAVLAMCALGSTRDGFALDEREPMPYDAPPSVPTVVPDDAPGIAHRYRYAIVDDPRITGRGVLGGWLRAEDARPFDAPAVVAAADAWLPVLGVHAPEPVMVPTIELTVHLRRALPPADANDWLACRFRSATVAEGYVEEDGELWAADGTLLAISRQLSVVRPLR